MEPKKQGKMLSKSMPNHKIRFSDPKRFGKQKGSGIAIHLPVSATEFLLKVNSILEFEEDRGKLFEALRSYHETRKVKRLVRDLKLILNSSKKYPLFKEIRALIPQEHLFAYDKLTEGARTGERILRVKRHGNESLGLKFKGGLEHGIGIFVTAVIPGSSAHAAGVKIGDEILKINGLTLQESIHDEVVNLFKDKKSVTLVVKNNGKIPTKLNNEILWEEVNPANQVDPPNLWDKNLLHLATSPEESQTVVNKLEKDDRLLAFKVGKEGLGCSIRSGIAGYKGIFVSVVAKNSLAQQIGLKAGDQILDVNGKSFRGIKHAEAVDVLKSRNDLTMIVRHNKHVEEYFKRKRLEKEGQKKPIQPILKKSPGPIKSSKNRANFGESLSIQVIHRDPSDDEEVEEPENNTSNPSNLEYDEAVLQGKEVHLISILKTNPLKLDLHQIRGRIVIVNVAKGGAAADHGFLRRGDYLLNVEGTNLVGVTVREAHAALDEAMARLSPFIDLIVACTAGRAPLPLSLEASSPQALVNLPASKLQSTKSLSGGENVDDNTGVRGRIAAYESMATHDIKPSLARRDSVEMMRNSLRLYQGKLRGDVPVDKLFPQGSLDSMDNIGGSIPLPASSASPSTERIEVQVHSSPTKQSERHVQFEIFSDYNNNYLQRSNASQINFMPSSLESSESSTQSARREINELGVPYNNFEPDQSHQLFLSNPVSSYSTNSDTMDNFPSYQSTLNSDYDVGPEFDSIANNIRAQTAMILGAPVNSRPGGMSSPQYASSLRSDPEERVSVAKIVNQDSNSNTMHSNKNSLERELRTLETIPLNSKVQEEYKQQLTEMQDPAEPLYSQVNKNRIERHSVTFAEDLTLEDKKSWLKDPVVTFDDTSLATGSNQQIQTNGNSKENPVSSMPKLVNSERLRSSSLSTRVTFGTLTEEEDEYEDENPYATISEARSLKPEVTKVNFVDFTEVHGSNFNDTQAMISPNTTTREENDFDDSGQSTMKTISQDFDVGGSLYPASYDPDFSRDANETDNEAGNSTLTLQKSEILGHALVPPADYEGSSHYETYIGTGVAIQPVPSGTSTSASLVQAALKKVSFGKLSHEDSRQSPVSQDYSVEASTTRTVPDSMQSPSSKKSSGHGKPAFTLNNSLLSSAKNKLRKVGPKKSFGEPRRHSVAVDSPILSDDPSSPIPEIRTPQLMNSPSKGALPPPSSSAIKRATSMPMMDQMMNELKGKMMWRKASAKVKEQNSSDTKTSTSVSLSQQRQAISSHDSLLSASVGNQNSAVNTQAISFSKEIGPPSPTHEGFQTLTTINKSSQGNPGELNRSKQELERDSRIQRRQAAMVEDVDSSTIGQPTVNGNGLSTGVVINPRTGAILDMEGTLKELDDVIKSLDEED